MLRKQNDALAIAPNGVTASLGCTLASAHAPTLLQILLMILLCRPELVARRNLCDRALYLSFLLLCYLQVQ